MDLRPTCSAQRKCISLLMDSDASTNMAFDFQCLWMKLYIAVRLRKTEHAVHDFRPESLYYHKYMDSGPRTLFEAIQVAGSATHRHSNTV